MKKLAVKLSALVLGVTLFGSQGAFADETEAESDPTPHGTPTVGTSTDIDPNS